MITDSVSLASWGGVSCLGGLWPGVSVSSPLVSSSLVSSSLVSSQLVSSSLVSSLGDIGVTICVGSLAGGLTLSTISTTRAASGSPLRAANWAALKALL